MPDQVRAALPGADAGGLQRIHAFLDHWGLINFEAGEAGGRAAADEPPFELAPVGAHRHRKRRQLLLVSSINLAMRM